MKSTSTLITILLLFCFFGSKQAFSQIKVGNNCTTINSGLLMEFESTNKGILLPRVALSDTATWTLTGSSADGMFVYNTATVSGKFQPGIYFWKTNKWHLVTDGVGTNNYWGVKGNEGKYPYISSTSTTTFVITQSGKALTNATTYV